MELSDLLRAGAALALACLPATPGAAANERPPVVLVSSSPAFDEACGAYYRQGNDQDVAAADASEFCGCLAGELEGEGEDALAFFARTYSEDLTTFIHEYPKGDAWMEASFAADKTCKGDSAAATPVSPGFPIEAASWGGVVRAGPGKTFSRIGTLEEGEHIMLLENTGVMQDGFPWFKVEIWASREGYQWGGLICGLGAPVEGTYEICTTP